MADAAIKRGTIVRVFNPHETTMGIPSRPWHYGEVIGYREADQPILRLFCARADSRRPTAEQQPTFYYFVDLWERIEPAGHFFSDN